MPFGQNVGSMFCLRVGDRGQGRVGASKGGIVLIRFGKENDPCGKKIFKIQKTFLVVSHGTTISQTSSPVSSSFSSRPPPPPSSSLPSPSSSSSSGYATMVRTTSFRSCGDRPLTKSVCSQHQPAHGNKSACSRRGCHFWATEW